MTSDNSKDDEHGQSLEELADRKSSGLIGEFVHFLMTNKRWWLTPIVLVLLLVGVMIILSSTAAAPFLYSFW